MKGDGHRFFFTLPLRWYLELFASLGLVLIFQIHVGEVQSTLTQLISIIVGFAFSLIFFLGTYSPKVGENSEYREDKNTARKLINLSSELQENCLYVLLLGLTTIVLVILSDFTLRSNIIQIFPKNVVSRFDWVCDAAGKTLETLKIFFAFETVSAFYWTSKRATYLMTKDKS